MGTNAHNTFCAIWLWCVDLPRLNSVLSAIFVICVCSAIYALSFYIAIYWIIPLQNQYFPTFQSHASLLFLPHGVRVLSAWMYGWRSIGMIAPVALMTHWILFGADGFTPIGIVGAMSGVVCAAFCFWLLAMLGLDFRISAGNTVNWRDVLIAGSIASTVNSFGLGFAMGNSLQTVSAYFIGDITGLFGCMIILMLAFKVFRKFG